MSLSEIDDAPAVRLDWLLQIDSVVVQAQNKAADSGGGRDPGWD